MRRLIVGVLAAALVLFPFFCYTYIKGGADGVARYQRSEHFALVLYSMYMFGIRDGYDKCAADELAKAGKSGLHIYENSENRLELRNAMTRIEQVLSAYEKARGR